MDYLTLAKDLISIDTSVPPGLNYGRTIDYLEPLFRQVGCETEKIVIPATCAGGKSDRVNLLAHRRALSKPRLIFYAHIDVVPAQGWPAFTPRVEAGKIYGRGAADMKGAIVALLLGMEAVRDKPLPYDVSVMITTDEEVGQADQIRYLRPFMEPVTGAYLFDLDCSFGYVVIAGLGAVQMDIRVKGKSVHSALSHLGDNAVEKASLLLDALLELKKEVVGRKSMVGAHPETGLTRMESRLNINMIRGGLKTNIVPDECLISIDRRLIPEENVETAEEELLRTLSSVAGVQWEVDKTMRIPSAPPTDDPIVDRLALCIKEVTGKTGEFGEMGSGDLGPLANREWNAKHFGVGVIRSECSIHGKDEFVYCRDIEDLAQIIARFVSAD